jgi:hypothetical protein
MSLTDPEVHEELDHFLGSGSPATVYLGFLTVAANAAGTSFTEYTGNGYARVAVVNNATNFPAAAARTKTNGTEILWPVATAQWTALVEVAVFEASSGGNPRAVAQITGAPINIAAGKIARIAAGALDFVAAF